MQSEAFLNQLSAWILWTPHFWAPSVQHTQFSHEGPHNYPSTSAWRSVRRKDTKMRRGFPRRGQRTSVLKRDEFQFNEVQMKKLYRKSFFSNASGGNFTIIFHNNFNNVLCHLNSWWSGQRSDICPAQEPQDVWSWNSLIRFKPKKNETNMITVRRYIVQSWYKHQIAKSAPLWRAMFSAKFVWESELQAK